jgi:hypothetical protein
VRNIPSSGNRGCGWSLGQQIKNLPDGTKIKVNFARPALRHRRQRKNHRHHLIQCDEKMTRTEKLLSISSAPLCGEPEIFPEILNGYEFGPELFKLLRTKNGFYAFESALHVFPTQCSPNCEIDLETWNSDALWRHSYGELTQGLLFFAEDVVQDQFCLSPTRILRFKAETGQTVPFANSIEQWADRILSNHKAETAWPLANEWQALNGPLPHGKRLMPKTPFFMGGEFALTNLWAGESIEGMRFKGDLATQTKNLADGTSVKLHFGPPKS